MPPAYFAGNKANQKREECYADHPNAKENPDLYQAESQFS